MRYSLFLFANTADGVCLPVEDAKPLNELHYLVYLWPPRYETRRQNALCHFSHSRPLNHVGSRPTSSFAEVEFVSFF